MRASSTCTVGAAIGSAAYLAAIPPANADPAYSADRVIEFFAKSKECTRSLCIGAAEDCKKREAAAAPSSAPAHFALLVNFAFDSDQLTPAAKENLDQFATALKDPRLKGEKFEIDGHSDAAGNEIYRGKEDAGAERAPAVGFRRPEPFAQTVADNFDLR